MGRLRVFIRVIELPDGSLQRTKRKGEGREIHDLSFNESHQWYYSIDQRTRKRAYHALRHSFISILVAQGKTWDQIAAFVGHLDQRTTQRYIHFLPKDKRETANLIPFEF